MPSLDPLAQSPDCIDVFERTVQKTGAIASFIRRSCCAEQDVREDPIQCGGPAITHRAFDIAEEDDARNSRFVFCVMDIGFVEHDLFAVAPIVFLSINLNIATGTGCGEEPQMISNRAGVGVAMPNE